jgi:hypothetical protein
VKIKLRTAGLDDLTSIYGIRRDSILGVPSEAKPCRFTRDNNLARFQSVNDPRNPLISLSAAPREEIYDKVAMTVELTTGKLR